MSSKLEGIDPQKIGLLTGDPELEFEFIEKLGEGYAITLSRTT
jgi:hypothetical protein